MLLYSTRAALATLPIDGCHKGLTLHHPLNHVTVAILLKAITDWVQQFRCCTGAKFKSTFHIIDMYLELLNHSCGSKKSWKRKSQREAGDDDFEDKENTG